MDEETREDRLDFLIPQHEFFHQAMVLADCESELFRDESRGLEAGAFFLATLLNRKEAQTSKGKNSLDSLKDFFLLKADARFCQYFFHKHGLSQTQDNTPDLMKTSPATAKVNYLHDLVSKCLRDLLPYFKGSDVASDTSQQLLDHPLQKKRKEALNISPTPQTVPHLETLAGSTLITEEVAEATASGVVQNISKDIVLNQHLEKTCVTVSSSRTKIIFTCKICKFQSKYETICLSHIEICLDTKNTTINTTNTDAVGIEGPGDELGEDNDSEDKKGDKFFNYKNGEFFIDSIFAISTIFEKHGDGLGCLIVCKMLLPIFHGLNHNNYSSSIHRFITRILCEANPREALKLVHERFSNRAGKPGKNVFRDRRMEFRIGITKKLIENLGPNFNNLTVKQVNQMVDIKEELYLLTRKSHGVNIRTGRHVPRSDEADFRTLVQNLTDTEAHSKIEGRQFGSFDLPENIMDDERFDQARFYRWIVQKNEDAKELIEAKRI